MELNESDEEFGFSRNYFLAKELRGCGKKSKSTQKLSELDIADEQELREEASKLVPKHEKEISLLMNNYKNLYSKWVFELRCGFGLLLYGFGSKKALIEDFASTRLTDSGVVVINGYLQSINLKHVAATLAEVLLHNLKMKRKTSLGQSLLPFSSQSMEDLLAFLNGSHSEERHCYVCVVAHNIDGPGLREPESQQILARIASCSLVRMVASVDHVNAPLLWDKKMVHTQFNWSWYHVPTFAPYKVEGLFFPLILASGGTTTHSAKTAVIVLESLPPNAVTAFKVLAEHQLAHPDEEGLSLNDWHPICFKRSFMSRDTLSSYLREFRDHELVKTRRHTDGQDCYYVPLTSEVIEKLLQEIG